MSEPPPVPPSVRAQLLATEHWNLLATRSQTWNEVMSRIMGQFTFTSAVLVVLALVVQKPQSPSKISSGRGRSVPESMGPVWHQVQRALAPCAP